MNKKSWLYFLVVYNKTIKFKKLNKRKEVTIWFTNTIILNWTEKLLKFLAQRKSSHKTWTCLKSQYLLRQTTKTTLKIRCRINDGYFLFDEVKEMVWVLLLEIREADRVHSVVVVPRRKTGVFLGFPC